VLNADASMVVQNPSVTGVPAIATSAGYELLPAPVGGTEWRAVSISDDGAVIYGRTTFGGQAPIVWTRQEGTRALIDALTAGGAQLTPWTGVQFVVMGRDGRTFLGSGTRDGAVRGLVARLPRP
jgi:hypothetical protein